MKTTHYSANYQDETKSIFERCGGTYWEANGILYPNLKLPETEQSPVGKYGHMRLEYLKKHRRGTYNMLIGEGRLNSHLADVERKAKDLFSQLVKQYADANGINEELKAMDQMQWVQRMNLAGAYANEVVINEIIFR